MKIEFKTDRIIGFSAMLISLVTLMIYFYQTSVIQKQSRLSVRPRLTFNKDVHRSVSENDSLTTVEVRLTFRVRNNGLGPAIIDSARIVDDRKSYNLMTFFKEVYPDLEDYGYFRLVTDITQGEALPANESLDLFIYIYDENYQKEINELFGVEEDYELPFKIKIVYSSMYEETWRIISNSVGSHPELLD